MNTTKQQQTITSHAIPQTEDYHMKNNAKLKGHRTQRLTLYTPRFAMSSTHCDKQKRKKRVCLCANSEYGQISKQIRGILTNTPVSLHTDGEEMEPGAWPCCRFTSVTLKPRKITNKSKIEKHSPTAALVTHRNATSTRAVVESCNQA